MTVEETLRIVLEAHEGQKDIDGKPAILHPLAVGLMGNDDIEIKAGFLHDVVEDSSMTIDDLKARGVEEEVLDIVRLLTRDKTADYSGYVRSIAGSGNASAINVKINDLKHNLARGRRSFIKAKENNDTPKMERLVHISAKHEKALEMLGIFHPTD